MFVLQADKSTKNASHPKLVIDFRKVILIRKTQQIKVQTILAINRSTIFISCVKHTGSANNLFDLIISEVAWILFIAQPLSFCGIALYWFAGFSIYFSSCINTLNNPHH
jgi:hypothetical protein